MLLYVLRVIGTHGGLSQDAYLHARISHYPELLKVSGFSALSEVEVHTAQPLVFEPCQMNLLLKYLELVYCQTFME
jgi:hypothetical protein